MMLKTRFMAGIAGCALAAGGVAFAAATASVDFEDGTLNASYTATGWSGDGVIGTTNISTGVAGFPISSAGSLSAGNKILVVEGVESYSNKVASSSSGLVDLMIKASIPDDALTAPEEANVQVAVAVDSNGELKVYCKNPNGTADWYSLGVTATADQWVRVSLKFDYVSNRCQVRINGEPKMTANGYYTTASDSATGGSWYNLVNNPADPTAKIAGLSVSGCTAIDEVVLDKSDSPQYQIAGSTDSTKTLEGGTVPLKWFDDNGIAWSESEKYGKYTAAESYERCLSPFSNETFELKDMRTTSDRVTFTIPETIATTGRKVVLDVGSDTTFNTSTSTNVTAGATTVSVDLPTKGEVKYYRLRATSSN